MERDAYEVVLRKHRYVFENSLNVTLAKIMTRIDDSFFCLIN